MKMIRLLLTLTLFPAVAVSQSTTSRDEPLPGQIIVDPENASYLVYNRDRNGDGALDPFFLIGPGDPEGLLYLGERQADGTRSGGEQQTIIERLRRLGGNGIYFQAVRSHGGDGEPDHNPWHDPADPSSGLNPDIIDQWRTWFDRMHEAEIVLFFFIYDDGSHPFDDGCTGTVSADERAFLQDLVNAFEEYPNLIWVVQEEFKFVGHSGERRPCDTARTQKAAEIAALIQQFDDHAHPVGVHHNIGDDMAFPDDPNVDVYVQQADVRVDADRAHLDTLHAAGTPGRGFDPEHRYVYIMGEAYNWHHALMDTLDRTMLRKTYYASAMAGGGVMVLGMYGAEGPPTDEMLQDMRRMQTFFESIPFNRMEPSDHLAHGGTKWVLADPGNNRYLLYTYEETPHLGVRNLPAGHYTLRWFDPVDGDEVIKENVQATGNTTFEKPTNIGAEALLYVSKP